MDEYGLLLIKREGQAEMCHNPKTGAYAVYLYEHVNRDEGVLLRATKFTREAADEVFDTVVSIL
ncbi:MAG: hypothetical protein DDT32_00654 [Syntrophomonadaceae bacterium]|nr:hypothetical protein [Bacillota bacterium]MBT9146907.1 hypothetical protein [Bacillota bacterium]